MFEVDIYIETSIKGPGRRKGWYAYVLEYQTRRNGIQTREDFGVQESTTYLQSGLLAMINALKRLNASCIVNIHTDNIFVKNMVDRKMLKEWKRNGWLNASGDTVANKQEWQRLEQLMSGNKVEFFQEKRNAYSAWMQEEAKRRFGF